MRYILATVDGDSQGGEEVFFLRRLWTTALFGSRDMGDFVFRSSFHGFLHFMS